MSTLALIIGICLLIIGIIGIIVDESAMAGVFLILGMFITSIACLSKLEDSEKSKTQIVTTQDSLSVPQDTIRSLQFIISYKEDSAVWCGDIKINCYTEKNIGDTITIQLK